MTRILSNGLHAPRRRRSPLVWLFHDLLSIAAWAAGMIVVLFIIWFVLVATP